MTLMYDALPAILEVVNTEVWLHSHVIGSSRNEFPESGGHHEILSILRTLLSFSLHLELAIITANINSVTEMVVNIARLDDIPRLTTTLHVALNQRYTAMLAIADEDGLYPEWVSSTMPQLREAHQEAERVLANLPEEDELTNRVKYVFACNAIANNKHKTYKRIRKGSHTSKASMKDERRKISPFIDAVAPPSALRRNDMEFINRNLVVEFSLEESGESNDESNGDEGGDEDGIHRVDYHHSFEHVHQQCFFPASCHPSRHQRR